MGKIESSLNSKARVESVLEFAYESRGSDVAQSLAMTLDALAVARDLNNQDLVGNCLNHAALFYMIQGESQLSMEASEEAMTCFTKSNDQLGVADAKYNIGSVYYKTDNFHAGLKNLVDALAIYKKFDKSGKVSRAYKTIGTIYEYFGNETSALAAYHLASEAAQKVGDLNLESNVYNPLSGIYLDKEDVAKALELIERSIAIKSGTGDVRGMAFALYGRGKIYTFTKQFAEAEKDFMEAERIHLEMGEKLGLGMNYYKMGAMYMAKGDEQEALRVLNVGSAFCTEYNISQYRYKCDYKLYQVYKKLGDVEQSMHHLESYLSVKNAVINLDTFKMIENYEYIFRQQADENKELIEAKALVEKQNQQLIKANAELDQFVYRASHDLRAPISSIMGLAMIGMEADDLADAKRYFEMIGIRVQAQDRFIHQIVENAKNSRLELEWEEVAIQPLVLEAIQSLFLLEGVGEMDIQVGVDEGLCLRTDALRFKSIMSNLLRNAVQYRDNKKDRPFIRVDCSCTDHEWILSVKDNGVGILKERQGKVFNMFYRGHEDSMGSGLGLFIVKETVSALGGTIEFESEHEVGSEFRLRFPLAASDATNL